MGLGGGRFPTRPRDPLSLPVIKKQSVREPRLSSLSTFFTLTFPRDELLTSGALGEAVRHNLYELACNLCKRRWKKLPRRFSQLMLD
jgi:hypothetical protein